VVFWRGAIAAPLSFALAWRVGFRVHNPALLSLRIIIGFVAMVSFFTAAKGLAITDFSLLTKLQPIFVAVLAGALLGRSERGGAALWVVLVFGFAGCALLIGPQLQVGSVYGVWALAAAALSAAAHVCIRQLGKDNDARVLVFYFQAAVTVLAALGLALGFGGTFEIPTTSIWPLLIGIGVTATAGQLLMTQAYREDRAAIVAAASYITPLWAVAIDIIAFDFIPGAFAFIGGAMIVGSGLYLLRPERDLAPLAAEAE